MTITARIFGIIFILLGIIGFFPNPLISEVGFFETDVVHNIVHLFLGILLVVPGTAIGSWKALRVAGVIYLILTVIGLFMAGESLFGITEINDADDGLHGVLTVLLLGASYVFKKDEKSPYLQK